MITSGVFNYYNKNENNHHTKETTVGEIYTKNMNKYLFIINEFMTGIIFSDMDAIINYQKKNKRLNQQLGLILLEYLGTRSSFKITIYDSEKYIFKNSGFTKYKKQNIHKERENEIDDNLVISLEIKKQMKRVIIDGLKQIGEEFCLGDYEKIIKYLTVRLFENKQWQGMFYKLNTLLFGFMIEVRQFTIFVKTYIEKL
eukprot:GAHX01003052.1.p1 GENE.GAHX01003052.1~~GAHX01003052.1.p1  ORF type:complete len:220 (-),score=39.85 GAHX01003052.1:32-628(-)